MRDAETICGGGIAAVRLVVRRGFRVHRAGGAGFEADRLDRLERRQDRKRQVRGAGDRRTRQARCYAAVPANERAERRIQRASAQCAHQLRRRNGRTGLGHQPRGEAILGTGAGGARESGMKVGSGKWRVGSGKWKVESGKWRGEGRMNGKQA